MTDAALITRVLGGDVEAFAGLVERYYEDCTRYARRMLGNRQDAEDALQEAFLHAYRALPRYRERDQFRAWLFRILVNQCRSTARQRTRRGRRFVHDDASIERASVEPETRRADLRDALQVSLDGLDPLLREALLLKHGEGLEYVEMASLTGSSVPALKMRVKRACDALRPGLERTLRD
jgi:RNA polymerase sigma-70 factor (ECF subfamily)